MTAIEFYDRSPVENIISSLTTVPDKIIFIGDSKMMKKFDNVLNAFLENRNINIELAYRNIKKNNLYNIVEVLSDIIETEEQCVFDLTGGDDLVLVAMGIVYQKYKDKHIQMQRFNIRNGNVYDCDNDGVVIYTGVPTITVEENILLHGGKIRYYISNDCVERTFLWDLTNDFIDDVNAMWNICRQNPGYWNTQINVLAEVEALQQDGTSLSVTIDINSLKAHLSNVSVKDVPLSGLLRLLQKKHLIHNLSDNGKTVFFEYKNDQVKKCLTKAGTILELKVLVTARKLKNKDGTDYYTDALSGVYIDWDGVFHSYVDEEKDTENEIDIVLMRGTTPVFISCKNGHVDDDELYKLDSVARRFGGQCVKKVLLATYLGKKPKSLSYFKQRAKDMNINLVDSVHTLTDEKFNRLIKHIVNN